MEIITIPIIDYITLCRNLAAKRGFKWVMVLMARERDAISSYEDIRKYWNSYDDLTFDNILFVFSLANKKEVSYDRHPNFENECWVRAFNPELLIINDKIPSILTWDFCSKRIIDKYKNMAIENHTQNISDLCKAFNISESQIPSLLLFNVHSNTDDINPNQHILLPINKDNLYETIKNLILYIEPYLKKIKNDEKNYESLFDECVQINKTISNVKVTSQERRFLHAKISIQEADLSNETNSIIQDTIANLDFKSLHKFQQPLRGFINQIISILNCNRNIEDDISHKYPNILENINIKLEKEKKLKELEEKKLNSIKLLDKELLAYVKNLNDETFVQNSITNDFNHLREEIQRHVN